ncbi:unnamed protein product [Didymodactylos carnosus]|uniref:TIR domain-containing protein n=1 Tax=Didymodactylos carnosus TaxID=1234261 RepID=A0A814M813_9BILA|nr:unnamed protein product [Didymodactylos carnosus]CAF1074978.1 unnamed protein product [Didymodactylos carnosus]CAF3609978.1 unnamed protein product [Didymodactylos carnosus]CAF3841634.1 unnamed protein product [Didymodactylos carnosus]
MVATNDMDQLILTEIFETSQQFFTLLRDFLITLFIKWSKHESLTEDEKYLIREVADLFEIISSNFNDMNVELFKTLLLNDRFIVPINSCIRNIILKGDHSSDDGLVSLIYIVRGFINISKWRDEMKDHPVLLSLLNSVVECLSSSYYFTIFQELDVNCLELTNIQCFLLTTCPEYIGWCTAAKHEQTCATIARILLPRSIVLYDKFMVSINEWSSLVTQCFSILANLLEVLAYFEPIIENYFDNHIILIDRTVCVLNNSKLCNRIIDSENYDKDASFLIENSVRYLFHLTFEPNILCIMKLKNLATTIMNLTHASSYVTQMTSYRLLANILNENDLKKLTNADLITSMFIKYLKGAIDDRYQFCYGSPLNGILLSLKSLVQHDQIKQQLVEQRGLPLLIRCATEEKFDPTRVQQQALNILWAMTFDDQAANILRQNANFLSYVKSQLSSDISETKKIAEGIIWKLEKESQFVAQQSSLSGALSKNSSRYKHDVMISYSHTDKDLCWQIQEQLVKDKYRVWLDRDQMFGSTMQAMADAIENSEFVFICMSDAYKQSSYCQSEAHYAFERQCRLIPLIMKKDYRPDGWLGIITSGKIYIDFPKTDFITGYRKLITEMNRHRNIIDSNENRALKGHDIHQADSTIRSRTKDEFDVKISMDQWTKDDVQKFLEAKDLDIMKPLCKNMNGERLSELYKMCIDNSESMFQTLKTELYDLEKKTLPVGSYLAFKAELKPFCSPAKHQPILTHALPIATKRSNMCDII